MAYLCQITKNGELKYQFVTHAELTDASFVAGEITDRLCDYHGGDDWWYECTEIMVVRNSLGSSFNSRDAIQDALSKVVV